MGGDVLEADERLKSSTPCAVINAVRPAEGIERLWEVSQPPVNRRRRQGLMRRLLGAAGDLINR